MNVQKMHEIKIAQGKIELSLDIEGEENFISFSLDNNSSAYPFLNIALLSAIHSTCKKKDTPENRISYLDKILKKIKYIDMDPVITQQIYKDVLSSDTSILITENDVTPSISNVHNIKDSILSSIFAFIYKKIENDEIANIKNELNGLSSMEILSSIVIQREREKSLMNKISQKFK